MVRIATVNDAEQLNILNNEFNGESETSIDNIRNCLNALCLLYNSLAVTYPKSVNSIEP